MLNRFASQPLALKMLRGDRARQESAIRHPPSAIALCRALDEEIHRLPGRERVPIVFCCLEARPLTRVARQLQRSRAGIRRRLRRGLLRLRLRLASRGWRFSCRSLLRLLREDRLEGVPDRLVHATIRRAGSWEHGCGNG